MPQIIQASEQQVFNYKNPFLLESGHSIANLKLCYSTYGFLNANKDNVIWVCHALTANSNVLDWWSGLFGENKLFDPSLYFIICVNIPGSCYGSTGPLEMNPLTGIPYYENFPFVTIKDVVNSFELLRHNLGIEKIQTCIGGSLGGQQALEWAVSNPDLIENLILLATNARTSPWAKALNETQRMAIRGDRTWGEHQPDAGAEGMKVARAVALLSYRSYETYDQTQQDPEDELENLKAVTYQQYQGEKFAKRFNAYSYWALTKILDSHNVGRKRGGLETALSQVKAKTLIIGISSDILFPPHEQHFMQRHIQNGVSHTIDSLYGHDGFLIETEKIEPLISTFLNAYNI